MRPSNRQNNEIRKIKFTKDYIKHPEGSVLVEFGNTKVICNATLEEKTPRFLKGTGSGWVTAEYGMLPRSTNERMMRESKNRQSGRTMEIQRLIGRSLRASVFLEKMTDDEQKNVFLTVDGNQFRPYSTMMNDELYTIPHECFKGGDDLYSSIAAASI